jgi:hypothetical protein
MPLSERCTSPAPGRWRCVAISSADVASSAHRWSRMPSSGYSNGFAAGTLASLAQPTILRVCRSMMAAMSSQPSPVAI